MGDYVVHHQGDTDKHQALWFFSSLYSYKDTLAIHYIPHNANQCIPVFSRSM